MRFPIPLSPVNLADTPDPSDAVAVAKAPAWLLNACGALEFLTSEHPKTVSTVAAILLTVGAIPSSAVAAGIGGGLLAGTAAQAVGAVAVGVGQALKIAGAKQQQGQQQIASK